MSKELNKTYDPKDIEDRLYKKWEDNGYFHAEVDRSRKPFTIVMPPPNIMSAFGKFSHVPSKWEVRLASTSSSFLVSDITKSSGLEIAKATGMFACASSSSC